MEVKFIIGTESICLHLVSGEAKDKRIHKNIRSTLIVTLAANSDQGCRWGIALRLDAAEDVEKKCHSNEANVNKTCRKKSALVQA